MSRRRFVLSLLSCWLSAAAASSPSPVYDIPDSAMLAQMRDATQSTHSFDDRYDAEVWLMSKSSSLEPFVPEAARRIEILQLVHQEASRAGLSPEVVLAVIEVESRFDAYAVSRAGALGLMQVMPFWKELIGHPDDNLINIHTNLRYGCTILKHYLNIEEGRLALALARYNGTHGQHWYPDRVQLAWERSWR